MTFKKLLASLLTMVFTLGIAAAVPASAEEGSGDASAKTKKTHKAKAHKKAKKAKKSAKKAESKPSEAAGDAGSDGQEEAPAE